jgi:hypothetical protein
VLNSRSRTRPRPGGNSDKSSVSSLTRKSGTITALVVHGRRYVPGQTDGTSFSIPRSALHDIRLSDLPHGISLYPEPLFKSETLNMSSIDHTYGIKRSTEKRKIASASVVAVMPMAQWEEIELAKIFGAYRQAVIERLVVRCWLMKVSAHARCDRWDREPPAATLLQRFYRGEKYPMHACPTLTKF